MGGRGSLSGKASASGAGSSFRSATSTNDNYQNNESFFSYAASSITRDGLFDAVEKIDPADFASNKQPDTLQINGVEFQRFNSNEMTGSNGNKRYISYYQATRQAGNGTFPTVDVVVERKVRRVKGGQKTSYTYDKSVFGTRVD